MASIFVILRKDFLDMLPGRNTDSHKQCAAALLNYFRNQRRGWLTINIPQFQEILFEQWGKEAIRKALEILADEGLVERRHHRMNGRSWQYRLPERIQKMEKVDDPDEVTDNFEEELPRWDEEVVAPDEVSSIYKDPLKDPTQDPSAAVEKKVLVEEKKIEPKQTEVDLIESKPSSQEIAEAETEIRQLRINPNAIRRELLKNFANFKGAVTEYKKIQAVKEVKNPAGLLITLLRVDQSSVAPQKFEIPALPEAIATFCQSRPEIRDYFFSSIDQAYKIVFRNGSQKLWSEVQL